MILGERFSGLNTAIFNFQSQDQAGGDNDGHVIIIDHPLANDPSIPEDTTATETEGSGGHLQGDAN